MLTAYGTIERAVQAMQLGAFDFVTKPFTSDHLTVVIKKALDTVTLHRHVATLRKEVDDHFEPAITTNVQMSRQLAVAKQAASSAVTVLLLGETGTGRKWSHGPFIDGPSFCAAFHPRQLRRLSREPSGKRAVWSRKRRLHRSHQAGARQD